MNQESETAAHQVYLFSLRVWSVNNKDALPQWRSRLQNLRSGEVYFCKDLESLMDSLENALDEQQVDPTAEG